MKKINYKIAFIISFCLLIAMSFLFALSLKEQKALLSYSDKHSLDFRKEQTLQKSLALNTYRTIQSAKKAVNTEAAKKFLLEMGENSSIQDNSGQTVLMTAEYCEQQQEDFDKLTRDGVSVFYSPIRASMILEGYVDIRLLTLLRCGANPNIQDELGQTPLHYATTLQSVDAVKVLLVVANPNIQNNDSETPLHNAVYKENLGVVEALLSRPKTDVNIQDESGDTPLHIAANISSFDIVEVLLDKGADSDIQDNYGETPLHDAVTRRHVDIAEVLLDRGANPNTRNAIGMTPLYSASKGGSVRIVGSLLDAGADPYATRGIFYRESIFDVAQPNVLKLFDERGIEDLNFFQKLVR